MLGKAAYNSILGRYATKPTPPFSSYLDLLVVHACCHSSINAIQSNDSTPLNRFFATTYLDSESEREKVDGRDRAEMKYAVHFGVSCREEKIITNATTFCLVNAYEDFLLGSMLTDS